MHVFSQFLPRIWKFNFYILSMYEVILFDYRWIRPMGTTTAARAMGSRRHRVRSCAGVTYPLAVWLLPCLYSFSPFRSNLREQRSWATETTALPMVLGSWPAQLLPATTLPPAPLYSSQLRGPTSVVDLRDSSRETRPGDSDGEQPQRRRFWASGMEAVGGWRRGAYGPRVATAATGSALPTPLSI